MCIKTALHPQETGSSCACLHEGSGEGRILLRVYIEAERGVCIETGRPTQSIVYVLLQVIRFQKSILLIVQYTYLKSCSGDVILQNLILHIRSCGTSFIPHSSWVFHFLTEICQMEMFCTTVVPAPKGHLGGASTSIFSYDS